MVFLPGPSEPVYLALINFHCDILCAEGVHQLEPFCLPLQMKPIPSEGVLTVLFHDLSPSEVPVR